MPFALLVLPLLLQTGPLVTPGAAPPIKLPPAIERPRKERPIEGPATKATVAPSRLQACLTQANRDPLAAVDLAEAWRDVVKGTPAVEPNWCLGLAQSRLEHWNEAAQAFLAGRDAAALSDHALRARLGGMAGNASLAMGDAAGALILLDDAHAEAVGAAETQLAGGVALDRARVLVALKQDAAAVPALAEARSANPADAYAWLLSATLSRRMGRLVDAQRQIETAAQLLPVDPEIGVEAGVISVLSGRDEAARKSWQSVIAAAPDSPSAQTAKAYLAQLDRPKSSAP